MYSVYWMPCVAHSWAYQRLGQGPDLVMLHGWATQGAVFLPLATQLAEYFRVTLLDLPGHGASAVGAGLTLEAALSGLEGRLRGLGLQRPHLLGWSLGGQLTLALAARQPASVARLVLIASTPCFVARPDWPLGMAQADFSRFGEDLLADPAGTVKRFLALQSLDDPQARQSLRQIQQAGQWPVPDPQGLQGGLGILAQLDLRAQLAQVVAPTLLIQGGRDRIVSPATADYLQSALADAQLCSLPRLGHAPFLSDPQGCALAIRAYLFQ